MPAPIVHHLNCASMHPLAGFALAHPRDALAFDGLVCHCLLIETGRGLVLVDTGLGTADVVHGTARLGALFGHVVRPVLAFEETARAQVEALGFDAADVRHIVLTHLDVDHAGGLGDFPNATVHVLAAERAAAQAQRQLTERGRYQPAQWRGAGGWQCYDGFGERWHGFDAVRALVDIGDDVLIVPMSGHTRGHAAIAVRSADGWLLHAGDAYFHRDEISHGGRCPLALRLYQSAMAVDNRQRRANRARLRRLALDHRDIHVFCSHDPVEFARVGSEPR